LSDICLSFLVKLIFSRRSDISLYPGPFQRKGKNTMSNCKCDCYTKIVVSRNTLLIILLMSVYIFSPLPVASQNIQNSESIQKRIENQYQGFISKGDFDFNNKNFSEAKGNYQKALEMDPVKNYPLRQIQKIDSIMLVNKAYESSIERADFFFKTNKLEEAKNYYLNALKIVGKSAYAESKVDYIDSVFQVKHDLAYLDDLEDFHFKRKGISNEEQYKLYIEKADEAFNSGIYNKAGRYYEWALLVLPEKEYAKKQLDFIYDLVEKQNAAKEQLEERARQKQDSLRQVKTRNFYKAIANANLSIQQNQFELAVTYYSEAARSWPEKSGDVEQLINFVKQSQENRAKNLKLYERMIGDADREYMGQEYRNALALYQRGNELIPDDRYPLKQIAKCDSLIRSIEEPYDELIKQAKAFEDQNLFAEAIKKYEEAAKLKPASKFSVSKITDIRQKHDNILKTTGKVEQTQADYLSVIKRADLAFKNKNYQEAALNYELATNLKPYESYPKEKLKELKEIQGQVKTDYREILSNRTETQYSEAINLADEHFRAARYTEARVYYKRAFLYKPDEAYPYNQLRAIDDLYSQSVRKELEQKAQKDTMRQMITDEIKSGLSKSEKEQLLLFQNLQKQADDAFNKGDYSVSRVYYQRALAMQPNDEYSLKQIDKIAQFLKARQADESNNQYQEHVQKANEAFQNGNFSVARFFYQNAQKVSPKEEYPKKQLDAIAKIEAEILREENEKKYIEIIEIADNAYYDENFSVAKYQYNKALEVKPDDGYAKGRIENIQKVLELQQNDKINKAYLDELRIADDAFYLGDFAKASFYYQKALKLKPEEEYPKQQIKKIEELTK